MISSFYTKEELKQIGFKSIGHNVLISNQCIILSPEKVRIGDNVRIDAFSFLSGCIYIHNNVHIATYCSLIAGNAGIEMKDYSGIAAKVSIYAVSDDYSGVSMTNPTIPVEYKRIISGKVVLNKHSIIGANTIILPNVEIGEGVSVGAMSLVNKSLKSWGMYAGIPVKMMKERSKGLLELEVAYVSKKDSIKQKIGDKAFIEKTINEKDVEMFGEVSGDKNPIHFDEEYAKKSIFKKRVAHGILTSSLISNVIGNKLPGEGTIYLSQSLKFVSPVYLGDRVKAIVEVIDINYDKSILLLKTECYVNGDKLVLSGEAQVKV